MKKNIAGVLLYMVCVVLVVFYITVLWWGKNPKVGTEYRMYYLTHELTDWPGYGKLSYSYGTTEYCTEHKDRNGNELSNVCSRKGQGWQKSKRYDGTKNTANDSGKVKVMTSFYTMYDFAQKIGGEKVEITNMVPSGTEPHDWEPSAIDIRNMERDGT